MHQHENYDDNQTAHIPEHAMLSYEECDERVYQEFFYSIEPDQVVEPVDEFIQRMISTHEVYDKDVWLIDDMELFTENGIYRNEWDQPIDVILDCDKMGSEVNTIIENMKGSY